jgi:hypothetical protein
VAESRQFGTPRVLQFGDKTAGSKAGDSGHCAQCEAMLADALDGTLSAADQEFFDLHMAHCGPCAQSLADARRGIAFLEMLRLPAPEPPEALVERILAQTIGNPAMGNQAMGSNAIGDPAAWAQVHGTSSQIASAGMPGAAGFMPAPALGSGYAPGGPAYAHVIPFPQRAVTAFRKTSFGQIMLQPRLAMTAAMAFFSVALTMNLTGFRPSSLRASDLQPSSLKRDFYSANARVVQYYEGLRVVYELESRVHDLQSATDDTNGGSQAAPVSSPDQAPAAQPGDQKPAPQSPSNQPGASRQGHAKPSGDAGASRDDRGAQRSRHVLLAAQESTSFHSTNPASVGRTRA